jgi:hypothetical protein
MYIIWTPHQILFGDKIKKIRWAGLGARMGKRGSYRVLVGKLDGKRALDRPRLRVGDNMSESLRK